MSIIITLPSTSSSLLLSLKAPPTTKEIEIKGGLETGIKEEDNKHLILSLHSFGSAVCRSISQGPFSL